jgi:nicotinate-nucleotide adenylyltransferase
MEKIGIQGGTFDPIHYGHLRPALEVAEQLQLSQVRFIPAHRPVHRGAPQVTAEQRLKMVELAIADQPLFVADDIEIKRDAPSYMVETLQALKAQFPEKSLVLILGMDAFAKFDTWHRWEEILELANLAVTHRPNEKLPEFGRVAELLRERQVAHLKRETGQIVVQAVTQLDISATQIRRLLAQKRSVDYLMPPQVVKFIQQHQLYEAVHDPK